MFFWLFLCCFLFSWINSFESFEWCSKSSFRFCWFIFCINLMFSWWLALYEVSWSKLCPKVLCLCESPHPFLRIEFINQVTTIIGLKVIFIIFHLIRLNNPYLIICLSIKKNFIHFMLYQLRSIFRKEILYVRQLFNNTVGSLLNLLKFLSLA